MEKHRRQAHCAGRTTRRSRWTPATIAPSGTSAITTRRARRPTPRGSAAFGSRSAGLRASALRNRAEMVHLEAMLLASDATVHHALNIALGPISITGFCIAVAAAFVLGQMIASREMERRGFSANPVADIVAATLVGFIIGAKLYYAALTHSWSSLLSRGGFVFWGGFAGSVVAGAMMIRWKKLRFWHIADVFCIGLAAGYSVGRTGCWAVDGIALHMGAIEILKDLRDTAPIDEGHSASEPSS